jgi:hypothetical protein
MRRNLGKALTLALALVLAACGPDLRAHGNGNGPDGNPGGGGDSGNGDVGNNTDGCSDEAKLIYVVDQNRKLLKFDPMTKAFTELGTLSCPASTGAVPFSMAIARDATAWVVYNSGELFRVETKNNLACTKSPWVPNTQGLKVFGMGFSTDQVGGTSDTLFISGGSGPSASTSTLTKLDLGSFQPATVGTVTGWPELTGTGGAELWGFFPHVPGINARIVKLNKASGAALQTYQETVLNDSQEPARQPDAWAFAYHGGSFWVFLQKVTDDQTYVYQFNAGTGAMIGQKTDSGGRKIVGAGVSTCAPIIIF